ncbi:FAD-dependent oxidoreductase [Actinokineospora sp. NPDC004072]
MVDVLVVGAGPVGLTVAHELARRGVSVRVVDRADGPATTSRATANHARTLEVYHQMGVLPDILARGHRVSRFSVHRGGRRLLRLGTDYRKLPTRFPFTLQVEQVEVERVLRERLLGLGVAVEWSTALQGLRQRGDHVLARLLLPDGRAVEQPVPWLVGADGGRSAVRAGLGIGLVGESSRTWLAADAVVHGDIPRDSLHLLVTPDGTILLVPLPTPGRWRLVDMTGGENDPEALADWFTERVSAAMGARIVVERPSWSSEFLVRQRMVDRMREGRCFLAGDAAHVHSPASGQGMCTGVQDGVNLAWKLADVIRGYAGEALLDSYDAERVEVGAQLLRSTQTATTVLAPAAGIPIPKPLLPVVVAAVNTIPPLRRVVERKILRAMSGLALSYADSPLTEPGDGRLKPGSRLACSAETEQASPGWRALCAELADPRWTLVAVPGDDLGGLDRQYGAAVSVRGIGGGPHPLPDPDRRLRRDLGIDRGGAVLIRPDGYLAGRFGPHEPLDAALRRFHLLPAAAPGMELTA